MNTSSTLLQGMKRWNQISAVSSFAFAGLLLVVTGFIAGFLQSPREIPVVFLGLLFISLAIAGGVCSKASKQSAKLAVLIQQERRKRLHVHAENCTKKHSISVLFEEYDTVFVPGAWHSGGTFVDVPVFEHTRCEGCGSEMTWEKGRGRRVAENSVQ